MLANWIAQTTGTAGAGNLTLAAVSGFPTFNDVLGLQRRFTYVIEDSNGQPIEAGIGYLSDATTLVRERVTATLLGGVYDDTSPSAANLAAGTYRVICAGTADAIQGASKGVNRTQGGTQRAVFSQHFTVNNASSNGIALLAGRMLFIPFWLTCSADLDALIVRCGTGVAGTSLRMGVYDIGADGHPNRLLAETGSLSSATSGVDIVGTVPQVRLQPGWYIVAIISDGAPTLGRVDNSGQLQSFLAPAAANVISTNGSLILATSYGPFPNPAPTTMSGGQPSSTGVPAIAMRLA